MNAHHRRPRPILLEVCIASVDDALAAAAGCADRLELNAALGLGGLTPSLGTLLEVKAAVTLPIIAMLRPRPGGFAYSAADFAVMQRDLDLLLAHGAKGVTFGILREDGTIDERRCRRLLGQVGTAEAVFHRAFDFTPDPTVALEQLVALGFCRVLTSGQQVTAMAGAELIAELIHRAADRIEILPGSGINHRVVAEIVSRTGCTQVHASLRHAVIDRSTSSRLDLSLLSNKGPDEPHDATNLTAVAEIRGVLDCRLPPG